MGQRLPGPPWAMTATEFARQAIEIFTRTVVTPGQYMLASAFVRLRLRQIFYRQRNQPLQVIDRNRSVCAPGIVNILANATILDQAIPLHLSPIRRYPCLSHASV